LDDLEPIGDFTELVESLGVPVIVTELPGNVHGLTAHDSAGGGWRGVVLVNSSDWWTRQRYTLAHELAHVIFRDDQPVIVDRQGSVGEQDRVEWRAECFARYFLAPNDAVADYWLRHRGVGDEIALAKLMMHFGISRIAAIRALVEVFELPFGRFDSLLPNTARVQDLMSSAGLADQWFMACEAQHEEGASPWLLSLALDAYKHALVSAGVVADVLNRHDVEAVELELSQQGWAPGV
jgi:Zn-dependent peptidase ImmA (M78 family)